MGGSGTSFATPMVSGTAAVMMGLDSSLVAKPEAVRAGIIAAAATHRTPRPQGGISNSEEGTGTLNTKWSALVVNSTDPTDGSTSHGDLNVFTITATFDVLTGCFLDPGDRTVNFTGVAGRTMRFVMVWNSHTSSHPGHTSTADTRYGDLDLKIYSPAGTIQGSSVRVASNVEYVDFTAPTSGTYQARVEIYLWDCANPSEEVGWAYVSY